MNKFSRLSLGSYFRLVSSTILLAVGGMTFVYANWLQIKAEVAQVLIEQAWQQTISTPSEHHKPWSWADFWPVAKLQLGKKSSVYVLSSASGQSLAFGPGHMLESSSIGANGQVMIAGHKDSHFSFLQSAQLSDEITLTDRLGKVHTYEITTMEIMDSSRNQLRLADRDELVLITCYPFNTLEMNGPMRLVVSASRIEKMKYDKS